MDPLDNLILAALPTSEREALLRLMRPVTLARGDLLYFFTSGAASLLILMENGSALEPAIIGREGMLGFPIGLGENRSRWRSVMQIPGEALVISRDDLSRQLRLGGDLPALLIHYAGLLITFVAQSAACAQFHSLDRRTARWLLLMHDRARGNEFAITQEHMAFMLGAHRPSETLVLRSLSDRGILGLRRGHIRILDRGALLTEVCECYARVQIDYAESVDAYSLGERLEDGHPYPDAGRPPAGRATPPAR